MIDRHGNTTPSYDYVRRTNARVSVIGKRLLPAEHRAVILPEKSIAPIESTAAVESWGRLRKKCGETVLLGCFEDDGTELYFPVNTALTESAVCTLEFSESVRLRDVESGRIFEGDKIALDLAPADGVCFERI